LAEELNYDVFWYPDEKFYRDVYVGLSIIALNTEKIKIGPCVTDPFSRHPLQTAVAIASLAEIAPGRTILGLGAGGRGFSEMGITRKKPAVALKEAIEVIRSALSGEETNYDGQVIQAKNAKLDFETQSNIPIVIGGGFGPLVLKVAGEMADGVLIHSYASPPGLQNARNLVRDGISKSTRNQNSFAVISRIDVSIADDRRDARCAVKPKILSALRGSYPGLAYLQEYPDLKISKELEDTIKLTLSDDNAKRYYYQAEHLENIISDELVNHFAVAGNIEDVTEQIRILVDMGIDQITIKPVAPIGGTIEKVIQQFITQVIPNVQQ
jgi:5,10-methylenetetrahydromethanopterin reductase